MSRVKWSRTRSATLTSSARTRGWRVASPATASFERIDSRGVARKLLTDEAAGSALRPAPRAM
jgi:hypothetical protein